MIDIRFVSPDLEWTETMKESVHHKIIAPLERLLKSFDLCVRVSVPRRGFICSHAASFHLALVLKAGDGRVNETVRCRGSEFHALVNDASIALRARLRKGRGGVRRVFSFNPFKLASAEDGHAAGASSGGRS